MRALLQSEVELVAGGMEEIIVTASRINNDNAPGAPNGVPNVSTEREADFFLREFFGLPEGHPYLIPREVDFTRRTTYGIPPGIEMEVQFKGFDCASCHTPR